MAETVQYLLEQMLPELEDLQAKGIFSEVRLDFGAAGALGTSTPPSRFHCALADTRS